MTSIAKKGYWAEKLGFKCQDCREYKFKGLFRCSLHRELAKLMREIKNLEDTCLPISKPERPILITSMEDFLAEFNKSKILEEREQRELKTEEEKLYEELLKEKEEIEAKIQRCLNKRHYLAVKKRYPYFHDQYLRIADCSMCQNYIELLGYCGLNHRLKNMRGKCSYYKFGKPMYSASIMDEYLKLQNESISE